LRLSAVSVLLICTLAIVLTVSGLAQPASPNQSGFIPVIVTDPLNRFVDGLQEENFVILENGVRRPITYFSEADSPITLAVISESPLPLPDMLKPEDEVIQTSSMSDALRQLMASKNKRKAIIVTTIANIHGVPAGIQAVQADPADVFKAVIELRNQYVLRFRSSDPSARVEVTIRQPRGLPFLKPAWKASF
jgi:hypothetical protein